MLKIIDPNSELELYDGTYPTGTRKKYYFDHIVYTQTAYPPDHKSFASHHYLREKKNKINNLMKVKDLSLEEAIERLPEDALDLHYWSYVNSTFENQGMLQFDKRTDEKLWSDHALIDGSDTIIENETCYRGVELHPRLNLGPLYRPNPSINPQVYINQPNIDGRGRVVWLEGDHKSTPRSAFMNNVKEQTGLTNYLTNNKVEKVFIVGMFRDLMVEATAIDAVSSGFDDVNIIYDATLPFGIPLNKTNVNNKFFFKDKAEIVSFLERIESSDDERNYYDFLKENNKWCLNLESKNIKIINSSNIFDSITVGKEEFGCGFNPEGLIKNFDLLLKTSTYTSRKKNATIV
jgi:nicotinamidase-related amidase